MRSWQCKVISVKVWWLVASITGAVVLGGGAIACTIESDDEERSPVVQAAELKKGEIVIAAFVYPGECLKCEIAANTLCTWARQNRPTGVQIKTLAIVACNRDIELQAYAKAHPVYDYTVRSTKELRDLLRVSATTRLVVLDAEGRVIGTMTESEFFKSPRASLNNILRSNSQALNLSVR